MRTGADVLAWMKPVEIRLEMWESWAGWEGGRIAAVKRVHNRYRREAKQDRYWRKLERFYEDMARLARAGHLSFIAVLNLWADHMRLAVGEELYADIPPEALEEE